MFTINKAKIKEHEEEKKMSNNYYFCVYNHKYIFILYNQLPDLQN